MTSHSFEDIFEKYFKPESRSAGRAFIAKGNISISRPSETELQAYIRGTTSTKVTLKTESFESPMVFAGCACSAAQKGQLCKHIWAALLKAEEDFPEFLEDKNNIEIQSGRTAGQPSTGSSFQKKEDPARLASQDLYKAKQADYRKQQYQKQKERLKAQKKGKSAPSKTAPPALSEEIQESLAYFLKNGFDLQSHMDLETVGHAKKRLSRIFHPDIGGSHDEIQELNHHHDVLVEFIQN